MSQERITSKELLEKLQISKDTLKHWRYGYYIASDEYRVYYREDMSGVPCTLVTGKSFDFYEYDLAEVIGWVESWKTPSQKKIALLKKLEVIRTGGELPKKNPRKKVNNKRKRKESHGTR